MTSYTSVGVSFVATPGVKVCTIPPQCTTSAILTDCTMSSRKCRPERCKDLHNNEEIGALKHDCWTYWGHSGAPLLSTTGEVSFVVDRTCSVNRSDILNDIFERRAGGGDAFILGRQNGNEKRNPRVCHFSFSASGHRRINLVYRLFLTGRCPSRDRAG